MLAWLEHNAIRVKDVEWYLKFFAEVFNMRQRKILGTAPHRKVWLWGGLQLNETGYFASGEGRQEHLGIMTDDVPMALTKAAEYGVKPLPEGKNWFELPDGLHIEVCAGKAEVIKTAATLKPWLTD